MDATTEQLVKVISELQRSPSPSDPLQMNCSCISLDCIVGALSHQNLIFQMYARARDIPLIFRILFEKMMCVLIIITPSMHPCCDIERLLRMSW